MKAWIACPVCSKKVEAKEIGDHFEKEHPVAGDVLLRLHPTSPYEVVEAEAEKPPEKPRRTVRPARPSGDVSANSPLPY